MFCTKCGAKNETNTKFCTKCGASLERNNEEFINNNTNISKKSNNTGLKVFLIVLVILIVLLIIGIRLVISFTKTIVNEDNKYLMCTSESESLVMIYNEKNLVGIIQEDVNYKVNQERKTFKKLGEGKYIDKFKTNFEKRTGGKCIANLESIVDGDVIEDILDSKDINEIFENGDMNDILDNEKVKEILEDDRVKDIINNEDIKGLFEEQFS